jgi:hypothetical protein
MGAVVRSDAWNLGTRVDGDQRRGECHLSRTSETRW